MTTTRRRSRGRLPTSFDELIRLMPPQAIADEVHYENSIEMIDRLMAVGKPTRGQRIYLETLVQLVEVYDAERHTIDISGIRGIDSLRHLLEENGMNASDLARLLAVHPSMGSKILRGERSLTVKHLRKLAERFKVSPELFID
ncbi:MAG TPA: helix-turn-helix domain-containing protein [Planctomycetota bacterium]|nr:helix-turn-helix domain-containing protein [Planctomycetota bacterium]